MRRPVCLLYHSPLRLRGDKVVHRMYPHGRMVDYPMVVWRTYLGAGDLQGSKALCHTIRSARVVHQLEGISAGRDVPAGPAALQLGLGSIHVGYTLPWQYTTGFAFYVDRYPI